MTVSDDELIARLEAQAEQEPAGYDTFYRRLFTEAAARIRSHSESKREAMNALEKALTGLEAGCTQYASRTSFGSEVPGDEQYPWVRLMQVGRDAARAVIAKEAGHAE